MRGQEGECGDGDRNGEQHDVHVSLGGQRFLATSFPRDSADVDDGGERYRASRRRFLVVLPFRNETATMTTRGPIAVEVATRRGYGVVVVVCGRNFFAIRVSCGGEPLLWCGHAVDGMGGIVHWRQGGFSIIAELGATPTKATAAIIEWFLDIVTLQG